MKKQSFLKILRKYPVITLVFMGIISLGFITITDRLFFKVLESIYAPLAILADLRLPSLFFILATYFSIKRLYLTTSQPNISLRRNTIILATCWLTVTAYFVLVRKIWVPALNDWVDYVAFMVTGLIAEEFLFRGILFDLSTKVFRDKRVLQFSVPVLVTSILFGLQHISYHGFILSSASITQVAYTTVMGFVFANIKESFGYLWIVILFHMINNSFALLRNLS